MKLENYGLLKRIKRVAGSSAGSLYAVAVACKANVKDISNIVHRKNFSEFKDDSWGYVLDIVRLVNNYGFCKGDALYEWYGEVMNKFTGNSDITFLQLYNKTGILLVITGVNVNKGITEYFSFESHPEMSVRLAMRISTSIPLFFKSIQIRNHTHLP